MTVVAPGGLNDRAGIGRLVTTVLRFWRDTKTGPAVTVVDPYGPARLIITPLYFGRALVQILAGIRRGRIRLLHVHMASRGSALRKGIIVRLAKRLGVPVILHLHGPDFEVFYRHLPRIGKRMLRRTLQAADRVVVLGQYWRGIVVEEIRVDPRSVCVLPNAVAGPPDPVAKLDGHPCRLLLLGRLTAEKGIPELLAALADARVAALAWEARIAGHGNPRVFGAAVESLGLGDRVQISGWIPEAEARRWLAESDIFVLPSHREGLSMALLEAMAFSLAVVTTPVGATEEAVVDGVSGVLVPVGDRDALAAALARLITDRPWRTALQAGARQRFCERFDIAAYCPRLEALYREVLGIGAGGTRR